MKKLIQKRTAALLAFLLVVGIGSTSIASCAAQSITLPKISGKTYGIVLGQTYDFGKKVSSSNKKILKPVKKTRVKALKTGAATVAVKGKKYRLRVYRPVMSASEVTLKVEEQLTLTIAAGGQELSNYGVKISWSSDDPDIASVKNGVVTAKSKGECSIYAKVCGKKYRTDIYVTAADTTNTSGNETENGNSTNTGGSNQSSTTDISSGDLRKIVYSLVSSAENSSLDYKSQYSYIEDINDERGYTAGIIGFTSGTGDLLMVVQDYVERKPADNVLAKYIPALEKVNGTDSHSGLGTAFEKAWKTACKDSEMIAAQEALVDEMYMNPAVADAKRDGLSPLGQYIYYDAIVVHGPGSDADSFGGIRSAALKKAKAPAQGGNEADYLSAFLSAREIIMKKEEAHEDLSRLNAQRKFMQEGNYSLALPLEWTMYGENFRLTKVQ